MGNDLFNYIDSGPSTQIANTNGGKLTSKDVRNYCPPQGPKGIMDPQGPGLHGQNKGITNGPDNGGPHSGSPGLGGVNNGNCGSQGKY